MSFEPLGEAVPTGGLCFKCVHLDIREKMLDSRIQTATICFCADTSWRGAKLCRY